MMNGAVEGSGPRGWLRKIAEERPGIILIAILIVAALFRTHQINQPFVDAYAWRESSTAMMALHFYWGEWNIFYPQVNWGGPGPNYQGREFQLLTYLAALGYTVFGEEPWIGRGLVIAFGLFGIFALYKLVDLVWDRPRALLSAAIMAVLPGSIIYDRTFVPDAVMGALCTAGLWLLVRYCYTERFRDLALALCVGGLGLLVKIPGLVLGLPAIYAIVALQGRRALEPRRFLSLVSGITVCLTIVFCYYLWVWQLARSAPSGHVAGAGKFIWDNNVNDWLAEAYFLPDLLDLLLHNMWGAPALVLTLLGLVVPIRAAEDKGHGKHRVAPSAPYFFHFWMLAMVIRYLFEAEHLILDPYNLYPINPAAAALSAHAVFFLVGMARRFGKTFEGYAVGALLLGLVAYYGYRETRFDFLPHYEAHYQIGKQAGALSERGELAIQFGLEPIALLYSDMRGWVFPPSKNWGDGLGWDYSDVDIEVLTDLSCAGAKWLIVPSYNSYASVGNRRELMQYFPDLAAFIEATMSVVYEGDSGMIYRIDSVPCA